MYNKKERIFGPIGDCKAMQKRKVTLAKGLLIGKGGDRDDDDDATRTVKPESGHFIFARKLKESRVGSLGNVSDTNFYNIFSADMRTCADSDSRRGGAVGMRHKRGGEIRALDDEMMPSYSQDPVSLTSCVGWVKD